MSSKASDLREKYPNRVPVICTRASKCHLQELKQNQYLVLKETTVGQFALVIRKHLNLQPSESLMIFVKDTLPPCTATLEELDSKFRSEDGIVHIIYGTENVFG